MSITTKTGDKGKTSLCHGGRVYKDDIRIEAYGALDELCSFLGLARSLVKDRKAKGIIEVIQRDLFTIGQEIAARPDFTHRLGPADVKRLEDIIDDLESRRRFKARSFSIPGGNIISSSMDIARTAARRVERLMVTLKKHGMLKNDQCLVYLNRASDILFLLARSYDKRPVRN